MEKKTLKQVWNSPAQCARLNCIGQNEDWIVFYPGWDYSCDQPPSDLMVFDQVSGQFVNAVQLPDFVSIEPTFQFLLEEDRLWLVSAQSISCLRLPDLEPIAEWGDPIELKHRKEAVIERLEIPTEWVMP